MTKYSVILFYFFCCLSPALISSQTKGDQFVIQAKSFGDSVILRWAPTSLTIWQEYRNGFIIKRTALDAPGISSIDTIRPRTKEEWALVLKNKNSQVLAARYAALAAQMAYGSEVNTTLDNDLSAAAINQANEQNLRYSYAMLAADLSIIAADGLALRYCDKDVELNNIYRYTISPILDEKISVDSFGITITCQPYQPPSSLPSLFIEEFDHVVHLSADMMLYRDEFTAYQIERSESESDGFELITSTPIILLDKNILGDAEFSYYDVLPENNKKYFYRLVGITPFAERATATTPSMGRGKDRSISERPIISSAVTKSGDGTDINWQIRELPDLAGFWVGRASSSKGPFQLCNATMLSPNSRSFKDQNASTNGSNFYHVIAVDTAGNMGVSDVYFANVIDKTPPPVPENLRANIDSTGRILLRWDAVTSDDLKGYHVYYTNDTTHEFSLMTGELSNYNYYLDSTATNSLNKYIYYRVTSVDQHHNQSRYSKTIQVSRKHNFAIGAPIITDIFADKQSIELSWIESSHPLASGYEVYIKKNTEAEWTLHKIIDDHHLTNITIPQKPGKYLVSLKTYSDFAKTSDFSLPIRVTIRPQPCPEPKQFGGELVNGEVNLRWQAEWDQTKSILIYRSFNQSPLTLIAIIDETKTNFVDREATDAGSYTYRLRAVGLGGDKSKFTNNFTLTIK